MSLLRIELARARISDARREADEARRAGRGIKLRRSRRRAEASKSARTR